MLAMFTVLRETALIVLIVLPLADRDRGGNSNKMHKSDWAVNENGKLESLSGKETDPNILR